MSDTSTKAPPFSIAEELVPSIAPKPPSTTFIDFSGLLNPPLLLQDDPTECGGQLWPGGMVLAEYLLRCKMPSLRGKTMFVFVRSACFLLLMLKKVGSANVKVVALSWVLGADLLALALYPLRPSHIHLTDLPPILPLLRHNISLNSPETSISAHILEWGSPISASVHSSSDILLAADCVYFEPAFPLLLQTMQELMGPDTLCYFCYKKRRRADMKFIKMARKVFEVKDVDDDPDKENWGRDGVHL
ncbi:MAG: hypothetical protein Q9188_003935 [Gyalolechia gomerana]